MKVLVTRHGQTEWNVLGKLQGQTDIELNDVGRKQAEEVGKMIQDEKIDLIITSPLKRAKETAEIINKYLNVDIIEDDRIMERRFGKSEGITKEYLRIQKIDYPEIKDVWNYNKNIDFNEMEKMHDFCGRVYDFLDEITEKYKDSNILIVSHGGVSVPITCYFTIFNLEDLVDRSIITGLKNCEVAKYIV